MLIPAELFYCPITKQNLHFRDYPPDWSWNAWQLLAERYALGNIIGILETTDGRIAYPVWKEVFGLLPEFARLDETIIHLSASAGLRHEKKEVARFYDEFG